MTILQGCVVFMAFSLTTWAQHPSLAFSRWSMEQNAKKEPSLLLLCLGASSIKKSCALRPMTCRNWHNRFRLTCIRPQTAFCPKTS